MRTVTVAITPLLCDIISQVVAESALIDIVARLDRSDQLAPRLQTLAPDLVILGLCQDEGDGIVLSLRNALPRAKVIALSHDTRHAYLPGPDGHHSALIELTPEALIEAIRGFRPSSY